MAILKPIPGAMLCGKMVAAAYTVHPRSHRLTMKWNRATITPTRLVGFTVASNALPFALSDTILVRPNLNAASKETRIMWFSNKVNDSLNKQVGQELSAALNYLAIAAYFDSEGLPVLAARYFKQADEERGHAMRLVRYILDAGGSLEIPAIPAVSQTDFKSAEHAADSALAGEQVVTDSIVALVELCENEKDHLTKNFLQWFVAEQCEELSSAETILKMIHRAGDTGLLQVEAYLSLNRHSGKETVEQPGSANAEEA
jgi:ferritin